MNNIWHDVDSSRITPHDFLAVIEIPKGSQTKYELDKRSGHIILDRVLYTSTHYPANYGFIPKTFTCDNDPLDVLVLCSEAIFPNVLVQCYPIGVINMIDDFSRDEKIIAIPYGDPTFNTYKSINDLPSHIFSEMVHFFKVYKELEGKTTAVSEIEGQMAAIEVIKKSIETYEEKFGDSDGN
jgi:inorganic pyrophosphatase